MGTKENDAIVSSASDMDNQQNQKKLRSISDIPDLTRILTTPTSSEEGLIEATCGFRRILSVDRNPPVDDVLKAGVLPHFVNNLVADPTATVLIFESAWALTNITSSARTNTVVEGGAVRPLIQLLQHEHADVREQAVWCLGNIAAHNADFRDHLLQEGAVHALLMNVQDPANMSLLNSVVWTISNLCNGKPAPDLALIGPVIEPLAALLHKEVSVDVLVDTVSTLSYISDGLGEIYRIDRIMQTGVVARLVEFLEDKASPLLPHVIRCLGIFLTGNYTQTQAVLDAGTLRHLSDLLESPNKTIRKESFWLAYYITAGTQPQITASMKQPGVMQRLIQNTTEVLQ